MKHSYLFEQRLWKAKGIYIDENGKKIRTEGVTEVLHKGGHWIIEGIMRLPMKANKVLELREVYKVKKLGKKAVETEWVSDNPLTGKLKGKFHFAGNFIVSTYSSQDKKYSGFETMELVGESKYINKGSLFLEGARVSSWEVVLA